MAPVNVCHPEALYPDEPFGIYTLFVPAFLLSYPIQLDVPPHVQGLPDTAGAVIGIQTIVSHLRIPANEYCLMVCVFIGIVIDFIPLLLNAIPSNDNTLFGSVISIKRLQSLKILLPIDFILVKNLNSLNFTIVAFDLNVVPTELLKYSLHPLHHNPTRRLGIHLSGLDRLVPKDIAYDLQVAATGKHDGGARYTGAVK